MYTYTIVTERTRLAFAVAGLVGTRGELTRVAGTVTTDERGNPQSVEVAIDARSLRTGLAARDLHLRTAGFLDVRRFPLIAYRGEHIERIGPDRYSVRGRLRLRGRDQPVALEVALTPEEASQEAPDGERRAHVTAFLSRAVFAIPRNPILRALLLPLLGDEIAITADVRGTLVPESGSGAPVSSEPAHEPRLGSVL